MRTKKPNYLPVWYLLLASMIPVSGSLAYLLKLSHTESTSAISTDRQTRLIVKPNESLQTLMAALGNSLHATVKPERQMSGGAWVLSVASSDSTAIASTLRALEDSGRLEYGQIDVSTHVTTTPNDRLFEVQWQNRAIDSKPASMNLEKTWDITTGSPDVVVAVVDTGVRYEHEDLTDRLLEGYDFVSEITDVPGLSLPIPDAIKYARSNDGDGRDPDASDPGDGVDEELHRQMENSGIHCSVGRSSWHGTAVASVLAANGDDGFGIAGIDWQARILPVRAVGRCIGSRSDLLDAIRWAAGVQDPALPPNPTPARIINVSIEMNDVCRPADQQAINDAVAAGSIIVAAVGNDGRNLDRKKSSPSGCKHVIGVAALNSSGELAVYSNYGSEVDIAAPGGEGAEGDDQPLLVATNNGKSIPVPGSAHKYTVGTSIASPIVAGVLSLMLSVNPELSNTELESLLYASARQFPRYENGQDCTFKICGAGMLDALAATQLAEHSLSIPVAELSVASQDDPVLGAAMTGESIGGCSIGSSGMPDLLWLAMFAAACLVVRTKKGELKFNSRSTALSQALSETE